jgi:tetratricopeptide (TPR) repeat protein
MTGFHLAVLGRLDLTLPDGRSLDAVLVQPKRLALLVYLAIALPRGFHRRDSLLALFWPELDRARGGGALRQALHFLRTHLPEGLLVNRGTEEVRLAGDRFTCDAVQFDTALDLGREEAALDSYDGDLLPGFHLAGAPDFSRWLDMERERLRQRAARAAWFLAQRCRAHGQDGEAAEWARVAAQHAGLEPTSDLDSVSLRIRAGGAPQASNGARPDAPQRSRPVVVARNGDTQASQDAVHAYVRGRHLSQQRTPASMLAALDHYHAALRVDPELAMAHVGLAEAWCVLPVYSPYPSAEAYPRAKQHAAKAIALDPTLAEPHALLALATVCYDWDWAEAERGFERAVALDPGATADIYIPYALYLLTPMGRFTEAIRAIERTRQRAPASIVGNAYVAMVCYHAREYDRAIREARLTLDMEPSFPLAWWAMGMAQEQLGDLDSAVQSFQRAVHLTAGSPLMLAQLARGHARAGNRAEAEALLTRLHDPADDVGPTPYFTATVYAALGDMPRALEWLERAYRARTPHLVFLRVSPDMDRLRGETRFRELLARLGLGGADPPP